MDKTQNLWEPRRRVKESLEVDAPWLLSPLVREGLIRKMLFRGMRGNWHTGSGLSLGPEESRLDLRSGEGSD